MQSAEGFRINPILSSGMNIHLFSAVDLPYEITSEDFIPFASIRMLLQSFSALKHPTLTFC